EHTDRAWPSRTTRASGRSPAGAKNNSVRPWHAASDVHASGPLKIKLEIVSTAAKADLRCGPSRKGDSGEPVGGYRPPESSFTILTAGLESVQQLGLMASIRAPDGRYQHKGDGWWSSDTSTRCSPSPTTARSLPPPTRCRRCSRTSRSRSDS